jgi:sphinganine-1-phosphate aldolase
MSDFPYADRFPVNRVLPERGRPRHEIIAELAQMAHEEDQAWEGGKVSGTMYCGDHEHYAFLTEAFAEFAHVNALQRDLCPSQTKFEGEIIAMVLDLMHADAITDTTPAGLVTSGGTGSILHAILAYREYAARHRGIAPAAGRVPNVVKPETAHPAFDKACHLFGIETAPSRSIPGRPSSTRPSSRRRSTTTRSLSSRRRGTIHTAPSTRSPTSARSPSTAAWGCMSTAVSGGSSFPSGRNSATAFPPFDFRVPGVTSISADTHKYGYAFKGSSVVVFRDKALRNSQYFHQVGWSGGKYMSPGMDGSRSGGLLAATWASMVHLGREGYRRYAADIFATAAAMMDIVRGHDELRIMGNPSFCFSFTSDAFDIYHVADFMKPRGWRFNGQQYPNAIHMAVTRPQTQPGLVEAFAADLADAVAHAREQQAQGRFAHSAALYGGAIGGLTSDVEAVIEMIMDGMLDTQQSLPPAAS